MLTIRVDDHELFDNTNNSFRKVQGMTVRLQHSLVSISKWESRFEKPFLTDAQKTPLETLEYIKCMTITQNVPDDIFIALNQPRYQLIISEYIEAPMTATVVSHIGDSRPGRRGTITNELIYYWMILFNIPVEFQKWHLNRLLTLINVCHAKQSSGKLSTADVYKYNKALNDARKAKLRTTG